MILENRALVLDLIEWVAEKLRAYEEVMGAWRTSCPRLPIWKDALDSGLVIRARAPRKPTVTGVKSKRPN